MGVTMATYHLKIKPRDEMIEDGEDDISMGNSDLGK